MKRLEISFCKVKKCSWKYNQLSASFIFALCAICAHKQIPLPADRKIAANQNALYYDIICVTRI